MVTTVRASEASPGARLTGLGICRASRVVKNEELVAAIDSTDEWIQERSGIKERRMAGPGESVVTMGAVAATAALKDANVSPNDVDLVICATVTHDVITPHAAALIATEIGVTQAGAHDLNAACSGFSYGVAEAAAQVLSGNAHTVLLIGTERMHDFINYSDRTTAFLFGDGAGAVVVQASTDNGIGPVIWGSDGSQGGAISQSVSWRELQKDQTQPFPVMQMQGQVVFRWAVGLMVSVAKEAIAAAGVTPSDLKAFVPHQANMRITDALVRELKLPEHVAIARDIATSGNTTAATIPLAMAALRAEGATAKGDLALLIAFGGGLAYSAQVVCLP